VLPPEFSYSLAELPSLFPLISDTGMLVPGDEGYSNADKLRGVVIDARDGEGGRLVFLGVMGWRVSNDHYPYYEMLFKAPKDSGELTFIWGQRFFYDVAGIEGMEWYRIWLPLALGGILVGFTFFTVALLAWRGLWGDSADSSIESIE
jgi:hypothetical protein